MFKRQGGVTFIGWLFLLVPIVIVGYAVMRLTPIYLNYMRVARSVDQTAQEVKVDGGGTGAGMAGNIRNALGKHFDIESINFPDIKQVDIRNDGGTWVIEAKYQDVAPLFYNISLLVDFDKVVRIGGG